MYGVQTLMARLKAKRFRQIFDYLDQNHEGVIDLLDLTTGTPSPSPPWAPEPALNLPAMLACFNVDDDCHNDSTNSMITNNVKESSNKRISNALHGYVSQRAMHSCFGLCHRTDVACMHGIGLGVVPSKHLRACMV